MINPTTFEDSSLLALYMIGALLTFIAFIAIFMWFGDIILYYTDPMYRVQNGKPRFWPFKYGNHGDIRPPIISSIKKGRGRGIIALLFGTASGLLLAFLGFLFLNYFGMFRNGFASACLLVLSAMTGWKIWMAIKPRSIRTKATEIQNISFKAWFIGILFIGSIATTAGEGSNSENSLLFEMTIITAGLFISLLTVAYIVRWRKKRIEEINSKKAFTVQVRVTKVLEKPLRIWADSAERAEKRAAQIVSEWEGVEHAEGFDGRPL